MSQPIPSRSVYSRYVARRTLQELRRQSPTTSRNALVSRTTQGTVIRPLARTKPSRPVGQAYYA
jgi:uncharacterized NAD(P)/FAD-binding protein YdhS